MWKTWSYRVKRQIISMSNIMFEKVNIEVKVLLICERRWGNRFVPVETTFLMLKGKFYSSCDITRMFLFILTY